MTSDTAKCICTPAIAGISDGPSVDCPIHGMADTARKAETMNGRHAEWCHTVTGCIEPGHCTCGLRENNDE